MLCGMAYAWKKKAHPFFVNTFTPKRAPRSPNFHAPVLFWVNSRVSRHRRIRINCQGKEVYVRGDIAR